jgi:hypothetical protein
VLQPHAGGGHRQGQETRPVAGLHQAGRRIKPTNHHHRPFKKF